MNIYTFDIFMHHCISVKDVVESGKIIKAYLDYLEVGPPNIPDAFHFNIIKKGIRNISSSQVTANWWRYFSSWKDYHGLELYFQCTWL